jgi:hypothetical protein
MIQWLLFITSFLFVQDRQEPCAERPVKQAVEYVSANQQGYGWVVSQTTMTSVEMNIQ